MLRRPRLLEGDNFIQETLSNGNHALVDNGKETYWVQICGILQNNYYVGSICSRIKNTPTYYFGDLVQIHHKHVIEVFIK